jgi:hypothetical protein
VLPLRVAGWVLGRILREPIGWLGALLAASAWAVMDRLAPVGLTTSSASGAAAAYQIAFLGALAGAALALAPLGEAAWYLSRAGWARRVAARGAGVLAAAALGAALAAALPALRGPSAGVDRAHLVRASGLVALHLAALGALLLRTPLNGVLRAVCLIALAWCLPAAVRGSVGPGWLPWALVDVTQHLGRAGFAGHVVPILAAWLAAVLLELPPVAPRRGLAAGTEPS